MAQVCNVTVMGIGGVGKSAMIDRFLHGTFQEDDQRHTIDTFRKEIDVDGKTIFLEIQDTHTTDDYSVGRYRQQWISAADVLIIVFALNSERDTFPMVLVGTMNDSDFRAVSKDRATAMAQEMGMPYIEISAKTNTNVEAVFRLAYQEFVRVTKERMSREDTKSKSCSIL